MSQDRKKKLKKRAEKAKKRPNTTLPPRPVAGVNPFRSGVISTVRSEPGHEPIVINDDQLCPICKEFPPLCCNRGMYPVQIQCADATCSGRGYAYECRTCKAQECDCRSRCHEFRNCPKCDLDFA